MAETRERETRFSDRMSDHEALMWNVEKDPWLNPSGASLTLLDGPVDKEHFRRTMRRAIATATRSSTWRTRWNAARPAIARRAKSVSTAIASCIATMARST